MNDSQHYLINVHTLSKTRSHRALRAKEKAAFLQSLASTDAKSATAPAPTTNTLPERYQGRTNVWDDPQMAMSLPDESRTYLLSKYYDCHCGSGAQLVSVTESGGWSLEHKVRCISCDNSTLPMSDRKEAIRVWLLQCKLVT